MSRLKKIYVDFRNFYPGFDPENNFLINFMKPHYDIIVNKENPDFVIFSVHRDNTTENKKSSLLKKIYSKSSSVLKKVSSGIHSQFKRPEVGEVIKKEPGFSEMNFSIPVLKGNFVKIFYTDFNCIDNTSSTRITKHVLVAGE